MVVKSLDRHPSIDRSRSIAIESHASLRSHRDERARARSPVATVVVVVVVARARA